MLCSLPLKNLVFSVVSADDHMFLILLWLQPSFSGLSFFFFFFSELLRKFLGNNLCEDLFVIMTYQRRLFFLPHSLTVKVEDSFPFISSAAPCLSSSPLW